MATATSRVETSKSPVTYLVGTADGEWSGRLAASPRSHNETTTANTSDRPRRWDGAFADLAREQAATDAALAAYPDLGARVGRDRNAVRELWVHRIEEYARHCGHADLLRERIDGRVGQ
ncbi:hypothetical protein HEK616_78610 (plasmid) [Streptomyces nigrescens]|uniref:DUF664 domain-containing protein n=1 Tax=Streptomyces nigrescens TaxID=1920 RepID=A0ABM8A6X8_STRNI|nr:DinB family protein [Streptomyces nigrescens]BDM74374.1 hypothetical protein HEK616_78610 [Streptomyces nigrescens]